VAVRIVAVRIVASRSTAEVFSASKRRHALAQ